MEISVIDLWLPILLSAIAMHIASTIAWTVLPHHKHEFKELGASEARLMGVIEDGALPPGQYLYPQCADMKEASTPEFKEKQQRCTGMLLVYDRPVNMGAAIGKTLAFFLVAAFMIGAVAAIALDAHDDRLTVFCFVLAVGVLTHCFGKFPGLFWFPQKYAMSLLDGLAFALVTAVIFALLWPEASSAAVTHRAFA